MLNGLDEDMEENTAAEKEARAEWLKQRDLILQLLEDFDPETGTRIPEANVDAIVERELAKEEEKKRKEAMESKQKSVPVPVNGGANTLAPASSQEDPEKSTDVMIQLGTLSPNHTTQVVESSDNN